MNQRTGAKSSCSLLQDVSMKKLCEKSEDLAKMDHPITKKHVNVLVSMLNDKNRYIKVLRAKIDSLNEIV